MAQAETEIRVACRWCGFFSKPSSACDVCGSPLPTDAPRVPLEVARAAVFSRADPISILEEPREPTRRDAWDRLLDVLGGPAVPRPRVVIDLEEFDDPDRVFPEEGLFQAEPGTAAEQRALAFFDQLAAGQATDQAVASRAVPVAEPLAAEPIVRRDPSIEFDVQDAVGGALFGIESWPAPIERPAPAWSAAAPVRVRPAIERPAPAWSAAAPVRVRPAVEPPAPAWSAAAPVRARPVVVPLLPAWSGTLVPTIAPLTRPSPTPAWGDAGAPVRRAVVTPPIPAWADGSSPIRSSPAPIAVVPAWSAADVPTAPQPAARPELAPANATVAWAEASVPVAAPTGRAAPAWSSPAAPVLPPSAAASPLEVETPAPKVVAPKPAATAKKAGAARPEAEDPPADEPSAPRPARPERSERDPSLVQELSALATEPDAEREAAPRPVFDRPPGPGGPPPAARPSFERAPGPGGPPPPPPSPADEPSRPAAASTSPASPPPRQAPAAASSTSRSPIGRSPAAPEKQGSLRRLLRRGATTPGSQPEPAAPPAPAPRPAAAAAKPADTTETAKPPTTSRPGEELPPGTMTCTRCGRQSDRALCEACRDALQELHALSLG